MLRRGSEATLIPVSAGSEAFAGSAFAGESFATDDHDPDEYNMEEPAVQGSAEQEGNQSPKERERPPWITPDPQNNDAAFWCEHPEVSGRFVMERPSLRRELMIERIKGREMGPFPTPSGEALAEWMALLSVGFVEVPAGAPRVELPANANAEAKRKAPFDPGQLVDEELIEALYEEVSAFWKRFRDARKPTIAV